MKMDRSTAGEERTKRHDGTMDMMMKKGPGAMGMMMRMQNMSQ